MFNKGMEMMLANMLGIKPEDLAQIKDELIPRAQKAIEFMLHKTVEMDQKVNAILNNQRLLYEMMVENNLIKPTPKIEAETNGPGKPN